MMGAAIGGQQPLASFLLSRTKMIIGGLVLLCPGHFGLELGDFGLDIVGHDDDSLCG
jgi:hypothetical protein